MSLRSIIVGLGVQGYKRREFAGADAVASVDPHNPEATYRDIGDVALGDFDAAMVCTPDEAKIELLNYLVGNGKHVLVEKPMLAADANAINTLAELARSKNVTCYTAYNHRFEPHFASMAELLRSGKLGRIYSVRMFYGNGTARLVRNSPWRDKGAGVLPDLGSHLLDTILFWLGRPSAPFEVFSANRFENQSFDHISFGSNGAPVIQLEMTLLSWRNHFYADVFAEKGSAHITSLCKWGPSSFVVRDRKLPSGRPDERTVTLVQSDPTWRLEYEHFKSLCALGESNVQNDIWINDVINALTNQSMEKFAS
jgi:predicted dehydrogenase